MQLAVAGNVSSFNYSDYMYTSNNKPLYRTEREIGTSYIAETYIITVNLRDLTIRRLSITTQLFEHYRQREISITFSRKIYNLPNCGCQ